MRLIFEIHCTAFNVALGAKVVLFSETTIAHSLYLHKEAFIQKKYKNKSSLE